MAKKIPTSKLKELYRMEGEEDKRFLMSPRQKYRIERLVKFFNLNEDDCVADFGCGIGLLADLVANRVGTYEGVDFSDDYIRFARNRLAGQGARNVVFYCEDIVSFCSTKAGIYDKAFALDFSEHLYNEDFISIFGAIRNSMKDNGKLYMHTPNGNYLLEILKKKGIAKQSQGHIGIRNSNQYLQLLRTIGFREIKVVYLSHYIKGLSFFHFLSHIPFWGKYFQARLLLEATK